MTSGQFFLAAIIILILVQTFLAFKKKKFNKLFMWVWFVIWLAALTIVLWPNLLASVAEFLGIGRGADVVIYFAIIFLLFVVFKLYAKTQEIDNQVTKLARKIALLEEKGDVLSRQTEN